MRTVKVFLVSALSVLVFGQVVAAESGFLDDYSMLKGRKGDLIQRIYIAPNTQTALAGVNALMVDQPEVFLSPDSKYKGAKPDALKLLADTLRLTLINKFEGGGYQAIEMAGSNVVFMRWAITDLYLKKKKRNFLAYTPVGFVVHATKNAAIQDVWKKIDIVELSVEAEFIDSITGEVLASAVFGRGSRKGKGQKQELVSWEDLDGTMQTIGQRLVCNLNNAKVDAAKREDCTKIQVQVGS